MKKIKRALSLVLVFCMLCTMTVTGFAADTASEGQTDFMKVVHLDAGRKYFSVDSIKKIIDNAFADGYNYLELGVGNDGLRFLLDDMSVTVDGTTYASDTVKAGIQQGNKNYDNKNNYSTSTDELKQSDMDEIISYADSKGISIIPLINSPGHMDAILSAANSLTGTTCSYNGSARTIDVTNTTAVAFTQALIQNYVTYFAGKGCTYFNMGADEYANDVEQSAGGWFAGLIKAGGYENFVTYVNGVAKIIENANMTPMAFNDGIYYKETSTENPFDSQILISYWSNGWNQQQESGYAPASASFLANEKGFKILNTNDAWYYVLGRRDAKESYTITTAKNGVQNTKYNDVPGDNDPTPVGSMICIWCDTPSASYDSTEEANIADLMKTFATRNPEVFTVSNSSDSSDSSSAKPSKVPTADSTDSTADQTVTVSVGGTKTVTVSGDQTDNVNMGSLDKSIATVSAQYNSGSASTLKEVTSIESGKQYLIVNNRTGKLLTNTSDTYSSGGDRTTDVLKLDGTASTGSTALWTITGSGSSYTVKDTSGNYLTIGSSKASVSKSSATLSLEYKDSSYWTISQTSKSGRKNTTYYLNNLGNGTTAGGYTSIDAGSQWTLYEIASETQDATTLTFTGVKEGTTTVKVGSATYTINVVEQAPDDALTSNSINLEYWITNFKVYETKSTNGNQVKTITTGTEGVNTEAGVDVSTLAPEHAYSNFDDWKDVYYWQTMRLDADNKQTTGSGDDETADGTTLTHIRNLNGAWQYQTSDGTWHYFQSDDQLVAYYLQKTDVTKEITTYAKDWGYSTSTTTQDTSKGEGQVALTVAVVYPDGTVSPAESEMYSSSTTIFNYWNDRDIGIVAPTNNSDYDISKITVTDGTRDNNASANVWYTSDSITWEKTENEAGTKWYNETTVWDESSGTTPMVNGAAGTSTKEGITWSAKNTAKLVLIYLKPVQKETNLNVVYWDDTSDAQINKSDIQIVMSGENATYTDSLKNSSGQTIGTKTDWNSNDKSSSDYLPDDAYVTNSTGINQTINKNITVLPDVDTKYQTGLYAYQKAVISEGGKTLTLHYSFDNSKLAAQYVVDFGESVKVPIADIIDTSKVTSNIDTMDFAVTNGKAKVSRGTDNSITFTPTSIMQTSVIVTAKITFMDKSTIFPKIAFVPASNVMYEESFVKLGDTSDWKTTGEAGTKNQKKEVLGKEDIHGYDTSYDTDSKFSNGSAYKATLTLENGKEFVKTQDKATFTFTGTGFDLISECGTDTGIVSVVVKDANGSTVKAYLVDTYFTGDTDKIISGTGVLDYQVPIVRCTGLKQGTYTVETRGYLTSGSGAVAKTAEETTGEDEEVSEETVAEVLDDLNVKNVDASEVEATCMDDNSVLLGGTGAEATTTSTKSKARAAATKTTSTTANVYIDGVRVYNTLNDSNGAQNYIDSEKNVEYESVYDYVKNSLDSDGESTAVYVEYDGNQDAWNIADYKQQGPENEVYLAPGNSIAIALDGYTTGDTVQIAAKAINGEVSCDGLKKKSLSTATEMYYTAEVVGNDDSAYVQITNNKDSKGVLALSEMKVSSGINAIADPELKEEVLDKLNHKADFVPETLTVSAPETLVKGHLSTLSVKASASDVKEVYLSLDNGEAEKLEANNSKAVKRGKSKTYSYSVAINSENELSVGEHTYSVYAVSKDGKYSDPVVAKVQVTEN